MTDTIKLVLVAAAIALAVAYATTFRQDAPTATAIVEDTMADEWGRSVRVYLDMPSVAFFSQMPDSVSAGFMDRRGDLSQHVITWSDGSRVVTYWRSGPQGQGIVLDHIAHVGR